MKPFSDKTSSRVFSFSNVLKTIEAGSNSCLHDVAMRDVSVSDTFGGYPTSPELSTYQSRANYRSRSLRKLKACS